MCLYCGISRSVLRDSKYAYERRLGEMIAAMVEIAIDVAKGAPHAHVEQRLIERGFDRAEQKDMMPTAIAVLAALGSRSLIGKPIDA